MPPLSPNPNVGSERPTCRFLIGGDPQGADEAQPLREMLELALSFALLDRPLDLILTGVAATLPQAETTPEIDELWEFLRDSAAVCIRIHDPPQGTEVPYPCLADHDLARLLAHSGPAFYL